MLKKYNKRKRETCNNKYIKLYSIFIREKTKIHSQIHKLYSYIAAMCSVPIFRDIIQCFNHDNFQPENVEAHSNST